jgi:glycosyltransferase involved in cell wall biosynthesis
MKKKIFFIIQNLNVGGAQRIFIDIINYLSLKNIYQIKLIIISNEDNFLIHDLNENIDISFLNKKRVSFSFFKILKEINKHKPDVVFTTITNVNLLLCFLKAIFLFNFKLIIREANILSLNSKDDYYLLKLFLVKFLYRFSNKIICISRAVQKDLLEKYKVKIDKTNVIYNPINTKQILLKIKDQNKINEVTNFLNNKSLNLSKIIISIGKFSHQKGFDILIESMKYVRLKNVFLIIMGIGKKQKYQNLIKLNKLENKILLFDFDTNPYVLLNKSSIYVCSSRYEGFGNTILEALFLGLPVLSTPCHNGTNEIIHNLEYCKILENFEPKKMGEAITQMLCNINTNSKYKFEKKDYNLSSIVQAYESLI